MEQVFSQESFFMNQLYPIVYWQLCQMCSPCKAISVCKTHAIILIDIDEPPWIESSRCNRCALCVLACNFEAIKMQAEWVADTAYSSGKNVG